MDLKNYVVYDSDTFELKEYIENSPRPPKIVDDLKFIEVKEIISSLSVYYVENEELKRRTEPNFEYGKISTVKDGDIWTAKITDIPKGTILTDDEGQVYPVEDGVIEFSVDLEGTYKYRVKTRKHFEVGVRFEART